jgi:hypothetical protein
VFIPGWVFIPLFSDLTAVILDLLRLEQVNAFRYEDDLGLGAGILYQGGQEFLQPGAVSEDQLCVGQPGCI